MSEMAYYLTFLLLCSSTDKTDGIWMEFTAGSSSFGMGGGADVYFILDFRVIKPGSWWISHLGIWRRH